MRSTMDLVYFLVTIFINLPTRQCLRLVNKQWKNCIDSHPLHINEKIEINRLVEEREKMQLIRIAINYQYLSFLFWIKKKLVINDSNFTIACFRIDKKFTRYSLIKDTEKWKSNVPKFKRIDNIQSKYIPVYFLWNGVPDLQSAISNYDIMKKSYDDNIVCASYGSVIFDSNYINLLDRYFRYKSIKHGKVAKCVFSSTSVNLYIGLFDDSRYRLMSKKNFRFLDRPIQLNDSIQNGLNNFYKSYWENLDYLLYFIKPYNFKFPFISLPQSDLFKHIPYVLRPEWVQMDHFISFFGLKARQHINYKGWTIEKFRQGEYDKMDNTDIQNLIQETLTKVTHFDIKIFIPIAFYFQRRDHIIEDWMFEAYMFEFGHFLIQHKQMQRLKQMVLVATYLKFYQWIRYILPQMGEINWTIEEKIILHFKSKKLPKQTRQCLSRIQLELCDIKPTKFSEIFRALYVWNTLWLNIGPWISFFLNLITKILCAVQIFPHLANIIYGSGGMSDYIIVLMLYILIKRS